MRFTISTLALMGMFISLSTGLQAQQNASHPEFDVSITYAAQGSNLTTGANFWAQGGAAELSFTAYHGLGLAASVTGTRKTNISPSGVNLTLVTTTFGPRYEWSPKSRADSERWIDLFGEALVGTAHGSDSVFPSLAGPHTSASSMALQMGGGIDLRLTHHLALRLIQADWLRTDLPNATTGVQNNLLLDAGVVFRFH